MEDSVINVWKLVGGLAIMIWTNVLMVWLKSKFPDWDKKAWAPPLIGLLSGLFTAMAAGQITSTEQLLTWLATGLAAGATASSVRDVVRGK